MNTPNTTAPSRIELPGGWSIQTAESQRPYIIDPQGHEAFLTVPVAGWEEFVAEFAAAMNRPSPQQAQQSFWVVEDTVTPRYYFGPNGQQDWILDRNKAVRFSRKEDVEAVIEWHKEYSGWEDCKASEVYITTLEAHSPVNTAQPAGSDGYAVMRGKEGHLDLPAWIQNELGFCRAQGRSSKPAVYILEKMLRDFPGLTFHLPPVAALTQPVNTGPSAEWQPIETAPKDEGVCVLLYTAKGAVTVGYYDATDDGGWYLRDDHLNSPLYPDPTHWQPLPGRPTLTNEKKHA